MEQFKYKYVLLDTIGNYIIIIHHINFVFYKAVKIKFEF